jgi:hypothetical protein
MFRARGRLLGVLCALLLPVIPAQTVLAATITVDSLADSTTASAANCNAGHPAGSCRLRDAIAKSTAGDSINFSVTGSIPVATTIGANSLFNLRGPSVGGFFYASAPTIAISGLQRE